MNTKKNGDLIHSVDPYYGTPKRWIDRVASVEGEKNGGNWEVIGQRVDINTLTLGQTIHASGRLDSDCLAVLQATQREQLGTHHGDLAKHQSAEKY